jgi:hypothetical protein
MWSYMQELQGEILHGCTMEQMKDLHSNSNWWWLKWGVSNTNLFMSLQMAKDVVSFLTWAAEPEADERKLVLLLFVLTLTSQCAHYLIVQCFLLEGISFSWRSPWTSVSISVCLRSFNTNLLNAFEDAWNSVCLLLSLGFLSLPLMMVQKGHTIWGLCVLMKMLLHVCWGGNTDWCKMDLCRLSFVVSSWALQEVEMGTHQITKAGVWCCQLIRHVQFEWRSWSF